MMFSDDLRADSADSDFDRRVRRLVWSDPDSEPPVPSLLPGVDDTQEVHPPTPLIVLVPVLNRPQNVAPLCESFVASKTPGRLMFVVESGDTAELEAVYDACVKYEPVCLFATSTARTWPEKINVAFTRGTNAEWVLFCADDVTFHENWWEATAPLRAQPEIMVIGTNDLGNPAVMSGDHATHPLVRGSYLGTVDNPEAIVHTGYQHWYVDNEFVITAKIRGVWAPCLAAVVEHNHPYWQKGEWDSTYEKGQQGAVLDQIEWTNRIPLLQKLDQELNG